MARLERADKVKLGRHQRLIRVYCVAHYSGVHCQISEDRTTCCWFLLIAPFHPRPAQVSLSQLTIGIFGHRISACLGLLVALAKPVVAGADIVACRARIPGAGINVPFSYARLHGVISCPMYKLE